MISSELLTLPATMESSGEPRLKRFRLPDSAMTVGDAQRALKKWFMECRCRNITALLRESSDWSVRGMPSAMQLCQHTSYTLATSFALYDPTVHPRHSRLAAAIMAEHGIKDSSDTGVVISGARRVEVEAMLMARNILSILGKYRDLVKYPAKALQIRRNATITHWTQISTLCGKIVLPTGGESSGTGPTASSSLQVGDIFPDELDAEMAFLSGADDAVPNGAS